MVKATEAVVPDGVGLERQPNAGELIAQGMKQEGIEYLFGITGGHEWPFLDPICRIGIQHLT